MSFAEYCRVKWLRLAASLFLLAPFAQAEEPVTLELRAVAARPGADTQEFPDVSRNEGLPRKVLLEKEVLLGNDALRSAAVQRDGDGFVISIRLTEDGAKQFADVTTKYLGKAVGIVLGGKLVSAPRIMSPILGGSLQIAGNFTFDEAVNLAKGLNTASPAQPR